MPWPWSILKARRAAAKQPNDKNSGSETGNSNSTNSGSNQKRKSRNVKRRGSATSAGRRSLSQPLPEGAGGPQAATTTTLATTMNSKQKSMDAKSIRSVRSFSAILSHRKHSSKSHPSPPPMPNLHLPTNTYGIANESNDGLDDAGFNKSTITNPHHPYPPYRSRTDHSSTASASDEAVHLSAILLGTAGRPLVPLSHSSLPSSTVNQHIALRKTTSSSSMSAGSATHSISSASPPSDLSRLNETHPYRSRMRQRTASDAETISSSVRSSENNQQLPPVPSLPTMPQVRSGGLSPHLPKQDDTSSGSASCSATKSVTAGSTSSTSLVMCDAVSIAGGKSYHTTTTADDLQDPVEIVSTMPTMDQITAASSNFQMEHIAGDGHDTTDENLTIFEQHNENRASQNDDPADLLDAYTSLLLRRPSIASSRLTRATLDLPYSLDDADIPPPPRSPLVPPKPTPLSLASLATSKPSRPSIDTPTACGSPQSVFDPVHQFHQPHSPQDSQYPPELLATGNRPISRAPSDMFNANFGVVTTMTTTMTTTTTQSPSASPEVSPRDNVATCTVRTSAAFSVGDDNRIYNGDELDMDGTTAADISSSSPPLENDFLQPQLVGKRASNARLAVTSGTFCSLPSPPLSSEPGSAVPNITTIETLAHNARHTLDTILAVAASVMEAVAASPHPPASLDSPSPTKRFSIPRTAPYFHALARYRFLRASLLKLDTQLQPLLLKSHDPKSFDTCLDSFAEMYREVLLGHNSFEVLVGRWCGGGTSDDEEEHHESIPNREEMDGDDTAGLSSSEHENEKDGIGEPVETVVLPGVEAPLKEDSGLQQDQKYSTLDVAVHPSQQAIDPSLLPNITTTPAVSAQ
ncbi:hypothetical protein DFS34DRAFT_593789 [Phlyctochytrium arcticum]|nr:hypothetical protein DFS34DRAFT_593789 [Phlyctochytrium arcticum]